MRHLTLTSETCNNETMNYKAFIFDMDGTLVDAQLDFYQLRRELGIEAYKPLLEEVATWPEHQKENAHRIIDACEMTGAYNSTLYSGVEDFLATLNEYQIPTALFTRNSRQATAVTLQKHRLNFDVVITREDAPPKPEPDGLLFITQHLNISPSQALYIGDYLYDLQAGRAADIPTALYTPTPPTDFDPAGAQFTFSCFHQLRRDFLDHCESSVSR